LIENPERLALGSPKFSSFPIILFLCLSCTGDVGPLPGLIFRAIRGVHSSSRTFQRQKESFPRGGRDEDACFLTGFFGAVADPPKFFTRRRRVCHVLFRWGQVVFFNVATLLRLTRMFFSTGNIRIPPPPDPSFFPPPPQSLSLFFLPQRTTLSSGSAALI